MTFTLSTWGVLSRRQVSSKRGLHRALSGRVFAVLSWRVFGRFVSCGRFSFYIRLSGSVGKHVRCYFGLHDVALLAFDYVKHVLHYGGNFFWQFSHKLVGRHQVSRHFYYPTNSFSAGSRVQPFLGVYGGTFDLFGAF